jgi:hypothetical protein
VTVVRREPPYRDTHTPVSATRGAIEKLLLDYGAEGVRTTSLRDGTTHVEFVLETETGGVLRRFACRVGTPVIMRKRGGAHVRDNAAEMRMVYWYLKSLVEAASFGLMSAERVFFSHIVFALPGGGDATAGEIAERAIASGKALPVPGFGGAAAIAPPGEG